MNISQKGLEFIKDVEGVKLVAYLDTGGVWTIGVGHTGPEVVKGLTATTEQVLQWLSEDSKTATDAINKLVKVPLTQNQFDSLTSFVFNIGVNAFSKSTLLRLLNQGRYKEASEQFKRWNLDNGKVEQGLINRRVKEEKLFNS